MIPISYSVPSEITSPRFAAAFAKGCGGDVSCRLDWDPDRPAAIFGTPHRWPQIQQALATGRIYYGDHGYFGRGQYYRITRNAYQHDGRGTAEPARFRRFRIPLRPWRRSGSHIVVCPNGAAYCALFGFDVETWIAEITRQIRAVTDRPIRVRWKADVAARPLAVDLVDAWAVVAFSSNAAVEALLTGVPVFVLASFAAAARMGLADLRRIESPTYPDDREPFAWNLAAQQWRLDEIAQGLAWRTLQETEVADVAA